MDWDSLDKLIEQEIAKRADSRWRQAFEMTPRLFWPKSAGGRMSDETTVLEPEVAETENDGTVNLHDVVCGDCGEPMDVHGCPNGTSHPAPAPTVVTTRSTGPRKKADEHPPCAHCGGRIHWNNGAALVNFECMYRQYLLAKGKITDPSARLPVFTASAVKDFEMWVDDQGEDFKYGNMESAGGGGSTYSSIRPKAPPKPVKTEEEKAAAKSEATARRKAMKAAKSITDVASDVAGTESFDSLGGDELGAEPDLEPAEVSKAPRKNRAKAGPIFTASAGTTGEAEKPTSLDESRAKRREERQKRLREMQAT